MVAKERKREVEPLISVIIPVYNVEKYLNQCVESVLNQTYSNIEVILVNDGSTDFSGKICDQYAEMDERVKVCHQENCGVSKARNKGIQMATGTWITFLDSDDYLENELYMDCLKWVERCDIDLVEFGFKFVDTSGRIMRKSCHNIPKETFLDKEYLKKHIIPQLIHVEKQNENFIGAWITNKLFRAKIIQDNNIWFNEEIFLWEDGIFTIEFMNYVTGMVAMEKSYYNYRDTPGSLSAVYDKNIFKYAAAIYEKYRELYGKEYDFESEWAIEYRFQLIYGIICRELNREVDFMRDAYETIKKGMQQKNVRDWFCNYKTNNPIVKFMQLTVWCKQYYLLVFEFKMYRMLKSWTRWR